MKALYKQGGRALFGSLPQPSARPGEVVVRVRAAGICRTDIYVAEGAIASADPVVLGHEFSGTVHEIGEGALDLEIGQPVAVMPIIPCLACASCSRGLHVVCESRSMLGVDRDGCFAELVAVPARVLYPLPARIPFARAAYAEPVAAALAIAGSGVKPADRGLIYGDNRIAHLTKRVLDACGFGNVEMHDDATSGSGALPANSFDYVIETSLDEDRMREILRTARPRGLVILKSRHFKPVSIDMLTAIGKEITFKALNYGPFSQAIELLDGALQIDDLIGPAHPLEDFQPVFDAAKRNESSKLFFSFD